MPLLVIAVLATAAFVWLSGQSLPAVVASHFGANGLANGFMPRLFYIRFMLCFTAGLPLFLGLLPTLAFRSRRVRLNLPNRDYWLAPERRAASVEFLCRHNAHFATLLTLFLGYVHWLVLRANTEIPPRLSSSQFVTGLLAFGVLAVVWLGVLLARFRKPRA